MKSPKQSLAMRIAYIKKRCPEISIDDLKVELAEVWEEEISAQQDKLNKKKLKLDEKENRLHHKEEEENIKHYFYHDFMTKSRWDAITLKEIPRPAFFYFMMYFELLSNKGFEKNDAQEVALKLSLQDSSSSWEKGLVGEDFRDK